MRTLLPTAPILPDNGLLLHVGVHKTGTTSIQAAFADARPELAQYGVTYPGNREAHHPAALAVLDRTWGWKNKGGKPTPKGRFEKLQGQVEQARGRIIVSSEFFCEAQVEPAMKAVADLGGDRVHVVITLRNLGRLLPSSWQQYLKYGIAAGYDRWLENVFHERDRTQITPTFWNRHDHGAVVRRWAEAAGADHVTVMVLEDVDRSANFVAFAQMLGLPEEVLTSRMNLVSNRSMTAGEAELLRSLNAAIKSELDWDEYEKYVRNGIARRMVEDREPGAEEPRLHTPDWALDSAAVEGNKAADAIAASGVTVLGNLDALRVRVDSPPPSSLDIPHDVAIHALACSIREARTPITPKERARGAADKAKRAVRKVTRR